MKLRWPMKSTTYHLLAVLRRGAGDASALLSLLEEALGPDAMPSLAGFYRSVKRASDAGWVEVVPGEAEGGRGRPRQRYRITAAGLDAVRHEAERMAQLAGMVLRGPDGSTAP